MNKRQKQGAYANLVQELRCEDRESFRQFHRVDVDLFNSLLDKLSPFIKKSDTVMRPCISPGERLSATLRFLATGE